jgi:hypothetical protein
MPPGLITILADFLGYPMIVTLGSYLRMTALKSSFTAVSDDFDANTSSIHTDLERLVFASYIATANVLTETTLFPAGSNDTIANDIKPNGTLLPGVSDFVIFSNDVVTLSVKSLIVIPTIAVVLWIVLIVLMLLPMITSLAEEFLHQDEPEPDPPKGDDEKDHSKIVESGGKATMSVVQQVLGGSNAGSNVSINL